MNTHLTDDDTLARDSVTTLRAVPRRTPPASALAVEEELAVMHQSALRIRGVLHLLHEALQSGNGIGAKWAPAVCALIDSAERDLTAVDQSIDTLVDAHLDRQRR